LVCAPAPDPDSDTDGPCRPPRSSLPAAHPWHSPRTNADAPETHCPAPAAGLPPTTAAPSPNLPIHGLPANAPARTHSAPTDAIAHWLANSCRMGAAAAAPARSVSPGCCPLHLPVTGDLLETNSAR